MQERQRFLRVLFVTHSGQEALRVRRYLELSGYLTQFKRAEDNDSLKQSLESHPWDVVLFDDEALAPGQDEYFNVAELCAIGVPIIILSDEAQESSRVTALQGCASEFVPKSNLAWVSPAIERSMREAKLRRDHGSALLEVATLRESLESEQELRAQMESVLLKAERLRSLGPVTQGVTHDCNNALSKMLGITELLLDPRLPENHPLRTLRETIEECATIVRRLGNATRLDLGEAPGEKSDLNLLIGETLAESPSCWTSLSQIAKTNYKVACHLGEIPEVLANPGECREIIANLIQRAHDALPYGGDIQIVTALDGEDVVLIISDNGISMSPEEIQGSLASDFPANPDAGADLSLWICHRAIRRIGGSLLLDSADGRGTSVALRFPALKASPGQSREATASLARTAAAPENLRILVVEDEPWINQIVLRFLELDGHRPQGALNGVEALRLLVDGDSEFDLIITDRAMPEMNGDELAAEVKQRAPQLRIIMTTGFGDQMLSDGSLPEGIDYLLPKPISRDALRDAVVQVLSRDLVPLPA